MDELGIRLLRPTLRRLVDLFGESAHGDRDLDAPHIEEAAGRKIMPGVPVEACLSVEISFSKARHRDTQQWPPVTARKSGVGSFGHRLRAFNVADHDSIQALVQHFDPRDKVSRDLLPFRR